MMTRYFKALAVAFGCIVAAGSVSAQESAALPFVRLDRDPVSAGMGFAGAASTAETAYSAFRNSSVIPFSDKKMEVGISGQSWAPDGVESTNINFGTAFKAGNIVGFSFGAAYQAGEEYSVYNESGSAKGTYTPSDLVISVGTGIKILKCLSFGADFRYASQSLSTDNSCSAFAADAFLTYNSSHLGATAGLSSFGSSVKSESGESFSLPTSVTAGVYYKTGESAAGRLDVAVDADYFLSGDLTAAAGLQYSFKNFVFLRAGYHYGSESAVLPSFATLGLGLRYRGVSLDFAYLTANELIGGSMTFGLGFRF